jgi:hypothetical protein
MLSGKKRETIIIVVDKNRRTDSIKSIITSPSNRKKGKSKFHRFFM